MENPKLESYFQEGNVQDLDQLAEYLARPQFVVYLILAILVTTIIIFWLEPGYGKTNVFIYVTICSLIGSLSVMAAKGKVYQQESTQNSRVFEIIQFGIYQLQA